METPHFRHLPSVDTILSDERIKALDYPHDMLVNIIRQELDHWRHLIADGQNPPGLNEIVLSVQSKVQVLESTSLRPVINASGVILHTNLGRAPLSQDAIRAMDAVSRGYCNLEYELESGARGSRQVHLEHLLCELSGSEAAMVVNNNASAVLLGLTALARKGEVIVSRSQAVEIGGGFRIPDVMRQSGARLIEVGTTNCTYISDYEQAITPRTVALMRVHSSNFKITGFTNQVSLEEMVNIARGENLVVFDDLGSGCFLDTADFGLAAEPTVHRSIAVGAGLTFFSGDKLVGGPQAGIIVGKKELVDRLKKHPLSRAVRIDKVRLAGLAATLVHYLKREASTKIPIWRMIAAPLADVSRRALQWSQALEGMAQLVPGETMIGGGSLPGDAVSTWLVAVKSDEARHGNMAQVISSIFRSQETPIIGRISDDVFLLDPRSVLPEEDEAVIKTLRKLAPDIKDLLKGK